MTYAIIGSIPIIMAAAVVVDDYLSKRRKERAIHEAMRRLDLP